MENLALDQMRQHAQEQIKQQDEQNFERFCSFVDEIEAHNSTKAFEGLAEIQRADNSEKLAKFILKNEVSKEE